MNNCIKVKRAENDYTQQDLADKVGVSRQTINAIEKGKYDPSLPIAFKLAQVFNCQIEDLFNPE